MVYEDKVIAVFYTYQIKTLETMRRFAGQIFLGLLVMACFQPVLLAQKQLNGLWEGVLTRSNLDAREGYRFEMYLKVEGTQLTGRSYLYLEDGKVVEMDLSGYIYQDRSVYIREIEWIKREGQEMEMPFLRKFQLVFERSIWENKLEGYWQELKSAEVLKSREYGRIFLKRYTPDKA